MTQQIITFQLGDRALGVDIMTIREIRAWTPTTMLPHAPEFVCGVVNLRGTVLPVIDLSARLGWDKTDPTPRHVIIVVQIGDKLNGLIVDSVDDIVTIEPNDIQPPPDATEADPGLIEGLVPIDERMVIVVRLDRLTICSSFEPTLIAA